MNIQIKTYNCNLACFLSQDWEQGAENNTGTKKLQKTA